MAATAVSDDCEVKVVPNIVDRHCYQQANRDLDTWSKTLCGTQVGLTIHRCGGVS